MAEADKQKPAVPAIPFDPVRARHLRAGWTVAEQRRFILDLAETGAGPGKAALV